MRKNEKGFTLVELIVVIAIVAILAAVGIVGYTQFIQNARDTKAQSELDQVVNLLYADALVDGIRIEGNEIVDTGGVKVVEAAAGKLTFTSDLTDPLFKTLMNIYAEDLTGTFTLSENSLTFASGQGNGKVVVTTNLPEEGTEFTATGDPFAKSDE
jgi:prepilin-type N-terminal cleavage/methylation domain-containing protein